MAGPSPTREELALKNLPRAKYPQVLFANPEWHKAVFYRDPLARFLSGWADKCDRRRKTNPNCRRFFGADHVPFVTAAEKLRHFDGPKAFDGHFLSQTRHCGGLDKIIHTFETVENLDAPGSRGAVRKMLDKFELSEDRFDEIYPDSADVHATGARDKLVDHYGENPESISFVVDFYFEDYITFNIVPPNFAVDALKSLTEMHSPNKLSDEKLEKLLSIRNGPALNGTVGTDREGLLFDQKNFLNISNSHINPIALEASVYNSNHFYN
eukprot:CAMPEP_0194297556 /NCGR_PEP_ID=MMETSP0169-20130528/59200_1 /TAXON_ID=218684 /ORGANISM="Corethron pennatum, Strain L29A3" /LENGTH=267 /DNA_ID=CAMNT_0039047397 /DNA_START=236 /DNA_END=1036 /DNA_ORIENTATION=+